MCISSFSREWLVKPRLLAQASRTMVKHAYTKKHENQGNTLMVGAACVFPASGVCGYYPQYRKRCRNCNGFRGFHGPSAVGSDQIRTVRTVERGICVGGAFRERVFCISSFLDRFLAKCFEMNRKRRATKVFWIALDLILWGRVQTTAQLPPNPQHRRNILGDPPREGPAAHATKNDRNLVFYRELTLQGEPRPLFSPASPEKQ